MVVVCNDMTGMLHVVCMLEMILHPKIHTHNCDIWKTDGAWSCDVINSSGSEQCQFNISLLVESLAFHPSYLCVCLM